MERLRRHRKRLFTEQNGLCHWCGCVMQLFTNHVSNPPPDMCTLDHLDSRLSPERGQHGNEIRHVAACYKCNTERGHQEVKSLPIEILRAIGRGKKARDAIQIYEKLNRH